MNNFKEQEEKENIDRIKFMRKMILIENLNELGLSNKRKKSFIKYYYENIEDMTLLEALDNFK